MSLSARSSFSWSFQKEKSGEQEAKHLLCRNVHLVGASGGWTSGGKGLGGMDSHVVGFTQWEAAVVRSSFQACEEGLCGVIRPAEGAIVEVGSKVYGDLRASAFCFFWFLLCLETKASWLHAKQERITSAGTSVA